MVRFSLQTKHTSSCGGYLIREKTREIGTGSYHNYLGKNDEYLNQVSGTRDAEDGKDYRNIQYSKTYPKQERSN